jgi:hypothetical protein
MESSAETRALEAEVRELQRKLTILLRFQSCKDNEGKILVFDQKTITTREDADLEINHCWKQLKELHQ